MSIQLTSIDSLDPALVARHQEELAEIIQNKYPEINLRQGVFRDLVLYLQAIFSAKTATEIDRYISAQSLLKIQEDPDLANEDTVDQILSNFNIIRKEGTNTRGKLVVEVESDATLFIPANTIFISGGIEFINEQPINLFVSSYTGELESKDRLLRPMRDGYFGCTIPVVSREVGSFTISKGVTFEMEYQSVNFVKIYAASDFSTGTDTESNASIISRMKEGYATPCWGNRYNIGRMLRSKSSLRNFVDLSVIGMGDDEMLRDKAPLLPISTGGKTDIYVKSDSSITYQTETLYAYKTGKVDSKVRWQCHVPATLFPGMYRVYSINQPGYDTSSGYDIISQTPISTRTAIDDLESAYSYCQSLLVVFETDDITTDETRKEFDVTLIGLDGVLELQEIVDDPQNTPVNSDVLIKAAVPAFIDLEIVLMEDTPGLVTEEKMEEIRQHLTQYVNNCGFTKLITAGQLIRSIQEALSADTTVYSIDMTSEIWGPRGTNYRTTSNTQLNIPDDPENQVSAKTVSWFLRDVTIQTKARF